MANSWFQFQQFKIHQDRCAMKISTDAILLGSMADAHNPSRILDIGTGTGVIALMLAQRFADAKITGVELDTDAASQAIENMSQSPFASRLALWHGRIQDFPEEEKFDLIVSNPPYFPDHLKSSDAKRNKALHTDSLSFEELIQKARKLLKDQGKFWIILPPRQLEDWKAQAGDAGFFEDKNIAVYDRDGKPILRVVASFSLQNLPPSKTEIVLKGAEGAYTESYKKLLSGFLLGY
jgi:tRNA1Val (adenine37-N6)-methyltransferase